MSRVAIHVAIPSCLAFYRHSREVLAQHFSLGAPHRPIAFSFHNSLLFLVNFFQDDTLGAPCKALSISGLTVFRVEQTATLKMIKTIVFRELRAAPQPKSKASIHNRGDA